MVTLDLDANVAVTIAAGNKRHDETDCTMKLRLSSKLSCDA